MRSPAKTVGNHLLRMATKQENIAAMLAILQNAMVTTVTAMKTEYRARLEQYLSSMLQTKKLFKMGAISSDDYSAIDAVMAEKYDISLLSLYRGIDLIYIGIDGNMSSYKEVDPCRGQ